MSAVETELDERDAAIFSERFHAYQDIHGPRVGDFVRFADERLERISQIYDRETFEDMAGVQTSEGGSFYFGKGYISFSGSLNTLIPFDELKYHADHKRGSVWFFHHDHAGAGNGVNASMDFRVYELDGCREIIRSATLHGGSEWFGDYVPGETVSPLRILAD